MLQLQALIRSDDGDGDDGLFHVMYVEIWTKLEECNE